MAVRTMRPLCRDNVLENSMLERPRTIEIDEKSNEIPAAEQMIRELGQKDVV